MASKIATTLGRITFWLAWPVWVIYFRLNPNRTRVFVRAGDKLLLVRAWLGADAWGLPGGGAKRGESLELSACRELQEETGLTAEPSQLESLGAHRRGDKGMRYTAHYFIMHLDKLEDVKGHIVEIAEAGWFSRNEISEMSINADLRHGLKQYSERLWYNDLTVSK